MTGPVRLKDDAAFRQETGVDLAAERHVLTTHDVTAGHARLLAKAAALQAGLPISRLPTGAGRWKLAAIGSAAFVTGIATHAVVTRLAAVSPAPATVTVSPPEEMPDAAVASPVAPPVMPPAVTPVAPKPRRPVAAAPAPDQRAAVDAGMTPLADQLRLYESGRTALQAGNTGVAAREFRRVVALYPGGQMAPDAAVMLLRALAEGGHWEALEADATRLAGEPAIAPVRADVLRWRSLSRANLGKCKEAWQDARAAGGNPHPDLAGRCGSPPDP